MAWRAVRRLKATPRGPSPRRSAPHAPWEMSEHAREGQRAEGRRPGPRGRVADFPVDDMSNKIDRLKQLSDLKAQGALTEEEFKAQKRQILG